MKKILIILLVTLAACAVHAELLLCDDTGLPGSVAIIDHYVPHDPSQFSHGRALGACEATGADYLLILSTNQRIPCTQVLAGSRDMDLELMWAYTRMTTEELQWIYASMHRTFVAPH